MSNKWLTDSTIAIYKLISKTTSITKEITIYFMIIPIKYSTDGTISLTDNGVTP